MPDSSTDTTASPPSTESATTAVENKLSDVKTESSTVDPAVPADSPPAEPQAEKKGSLLDHIKKAVDKSSSEKSPISQEVKEESEAPEDVALKDVVAKDGTKMTTEDLKGLHPKTKERMQKLLAQNAETVKKYTDEKKVADTYRNLETFMRNKKISSADANQAFEIMGNFTENPEKALVEVEKLRESLLLITGKKLPPDLAAQVNDGLTNEAIAKETARLRLQNAQREVDEQRKADAAADSQRQENEARTTDVVTAVTDWEAQWKKSDPDYLKKQNGVLKEIDFRLRQAADKGRAIGDPGKFLPKTKAEATALAEASRKAYEAEIGRFAPPKKEITHVSGASVTNVAPAKAKNLHTAILQRVNNK